MPIDLMSLVEGGAPMPGKRPSGSGNLFANKELMANFEKQAAPDKPPEPQVPRKKWTPPPKPETEYQKAASANSAGGRMPWDPPVRKASSWEAKPVIPTSPAPRMGVKANEPGSPVLKDVVKSSVPSGREEDESPKSRLSDNPFMRRDSKEGLVARSPTKKEDAYPVISTVERPSSEKVRGPSLPLAYPEIPSTHALCGLAMPLLPKLVLNACRAMGRWRGWWTLPTVCCRWLSGRRCRRR